MAVTHDLHDLKSDLHDRNEGSEYHRSSSIAEHGSYENRSLLDYYAARRGNFLPTFWDNLSGPILGWPETSVRNYPYSLRNNPEERSSHLLRGGSSKPRCVCMLDHWTVTPATCAREMVTGRQGTWLVAHERGLGHHFRHIASLSHVCTMVTSFKRFKSGTQLSPTLFRVGNRKLKPDHAQNRPSKLRSHTVLTLGKIFPGTNNAT
jgi:hypothetical protein